MAAYTVVTSTAVNVAPNGSSFNSTKVKVVANTTCVYAINAPATLTSNVGQIPQNVPTYINMGGIGKQLSVLPAGGASTVITATECGTVYQSSMNQNYVSKGVFAIVNGSNVITGSTAGLNLTPGLFVTAGGINNGTTISSFTSGNVTLSANATANVTATVTFSVTGPVTA